MDTQQNVIVYPLLIMAFTFVMSLFGLEHQFRQTWENQIDQELKTAASSTLVAISYLSKQLQPSTQHHILHELAYKQALDTDMRLTIVDAEGVIVGDSLLSLEQLEQQTRVANTQEVNLSQLAGNAKIVRYSEQMEQSMVFLARYDKNTGYTVRVGLAEADYNAAINKMRIGFLSVAFVAMFVITCFGFFINQAIRQARAKERCLQDVRIAAKTRDIELMQTMTTMLNAAKNFDEVSQVILNIMPRLLPDISGKLYLLNKQGKLAELISWGGSFDNNVAIFADENGPIIPQISDKQIVEESEVTRCHVSNHLICVDLIDAQELFGVIHFLGSKDTVRDKQVRNVVMRLSEQISLGMTNLRVKKQLHNQAIRDPLTSLYNRRFMLEGFEQALNRAERHSTNLAVLMIDLDHFKSFNDTFGHKIGDYVLTQVAELFKVNLRMEDIACRFGGEEFCIICPDTGLKEGYALAEKLRVAVSELALSEQEQLLGKISISVGLAIYPNHARTTQQLINLADSALYQAKNEGRNTTVVFQDEHRGMIF